LALIDWFFGFSLQHEAGPDCIQRAQGHSTASYHFFMPAVIWSEPFVGSKVARDKRDMGHGRISRFARRPPQSTEHRARRAAAASRAGPGCLAPFQHRPIRVDEARAISKRSRRTPSADAQHASSLAARLGGTPAACGVQRRERDRGIQRFPRLPICRRSPARRAWGNVLCRNLRLSPPNLQH
jgi:hypothetical protein